MTITGIGAQTLIQAAVDIRHARPHHGALRHDLPRRPGGRRGADGVAQRAASGCACRSPSARSSPAAFGPVSLRLKRKRMRREPSRPTRVRSASADSRHDRARISSCFGFGYSALALARRLAARGMDDVRGTCRSANRRLRCGRQAFRPFCSTGDRPVDPAVLDGVTHLLVSVPPDAVGDPVLDPARRRYRRAAGPRPGSAICRPPGSMATAAAAGSTKPRSCCRPASAAGAGLPPSRVGSTCGAAAACRSTSFGSPASTVPAAAPSTRCAPAPLSASTSRARCSRASMSRIWRAC